jgi:tetratricopeptide (TPR) repeat protein
MSLYDRSPLLMSLGLGGITAFMALKLWHLARRPTVRLQNLQLKLAGRLSLSGGLFTSVAVLWILCTVHSGFVQWHRYWGRHYLNRTEASRADVLRGAHLQRDYSEQHEAAAAKSFQHFKLADRWGLLGVVEVKLGLAWGHLLEHDSEAAERELRAAITLTPGNRQLHDHLIDFLAGRGRLDDAVEAVRAKAAAADSSAADHLQLSGVLWQARRHEEAIEELRVAEELAGDDVDTLAKLAAAYAVVGSPREALAVLRRAVALEPTSTETRLRLGRMLVQLERSDEALHVYRQTVTLAPQAPQARVFLGALLRRLGHTDEAIEQLAVARELAPHDPSVHVELGLVYMQAGRNLEAIECMERAIELDPASPRSRLQLPELIERLQREATPGPSTPDR